jgi:NAD(P)-dependent dehydrogenase (short-subunit alcohol dehydrogenase family)
MNKQMQILILGASGMLGHTLFFQLQHHGFDVYGTMRNVSPILPAALRERIRGGVDVNDFSSNGDCKAGCAHKLRWYYPPIAGRKNAASLHRVKRPFSPPVIRRMQATRRTSHSLQYRLCF